MRHSQLGTVDLAGLVAVRKYKDPLVGESGHAASVRNAPRIDVTSPICSVNEFTRKSGNRFCAELSHSPKAVPLDVKIHSVEKRERYELHVALYGRLNIAELPQRGPESW